MSQIRLKTKPNIQIEFGYLPSFPWNSMFALWSEPYNICLIMSATNSIGSHKVSHSNDYPLTPPKTNSRLADRQTDWLTEGKTERQFCCQCNFPIKWIWVLYTDPKTQNVKVAVVFRQKISLMKISFNFLWHFFYPKNKNDNIKSRIAQQTIGVCKQNFTNVQFFEFSNSILSNIKVGFQEPSNLT